MIDLFNLLKYTARAVGGKHGLNKGWVKMIGGIYQMLNNQDTSVCTVMAQIKGPFLFQCRCLNYSVCWTMKRQSLGIINS